MRSRWGRRTGATLLALAAVAITMAQPPVNEFHGWLRSGNVAALAAAMDKDPGLATRPDAEGVQPLAWAALYGQKEACDLLLARGADPQATNPMIGTVLHAAVLGGRPEIIRMLAARFVDLNAGGEARLPPLVFAARRGVAPAVTALLDAGASANARDAAGNTALLLAASYGHTAIVQAFLRHKADVMSANDLGITPIEAALRESHSEVVDLLRAAGGNATLRPLGLKGPYLGQPPPGETRRVFAPGTVSTERRELNAAFTPDGGTFFFSRSGRGPDTRILMLTVAGGVWGVPFPAPFGRADASDVDMFATADGSQLLFCSDRPRPGQAVVAPAADTPPGDSDIWVARKEGNDWGPATWLGPEVNTSGADDYYPTLTQSGTLYFSSNRPGGLGENDIYRVSRLNGRWTTPENLGAPINTPGREFDPFISPDETYLVFASERPGGFGASDLYVSARNRDGSWTRPVNLGPRVNSAFGDYTPMVSPDGRYLFLTSGAPGCDDLYWVAASVIRQALAAVVR
jgi:Tol biopolymer transport system component